MKKILFESVAIDVASEAETRTRNSGVMVISPASKAYDEGGLDTNHFVGSFDCSDPWPKVRCDLH